jgi:FtsH-binding integral membrane protein
MLMLKFGDPKAMFTTAGAVPVLSGTAMAILMQAIVITLAIFIGLTLTVFITKKDFSFLRGFLTICTFAALGVILAAILFGFSLGALFAGLMILLMGGYILYQTSLVMSQFPPTAHVAAALMLFSTVATLFWYVLNFLMSMRRD